MKKDLTKELLYLLAGVQLKTRCHISVKDLDVIGLSIKDIKRQCQLVKEHNTHYLFYVSNDKIIIGLTLIIYK